MELIHDGKRYKLTVISEDCPVDDLGCDETSIIIDFRTVNPDDVINKLSTFSQLIQLIQNPKVSFIWVNCCISKFFEIKERLRKRLMDTNFTESAISRLLFKLTTHQHNSEELEALKTSIGVLSFRQNMLDIDRIRDAHPGISHSINLLTKRKRKEFRDTVVAERTAVSQSYDDKRRPGKKVFKALKRMQPDQSEETTPNKYCYMCKSKGVYGSLCNDCLVLNGNMKRVSCDLKGRYAIVTGGRIKIGFETALRLLRDGCFVIVTTRFPVDGAKRFSGMTDFDVWKHRLKICRLDLQDMKTIEEFLTYVKSNIPHLDILINNAAQTIYRPPQYYQTLTSNEVKDVLSLPNDASNLVVNKTQPHLDQRLQGSNPPVLSILPFPASTIPSTSSEFPLDKKDEHGEQLDLRQRNSWTYNLDEVPLRELLQVLTVNAVGPFILTAKLKPLLKGSPFQRKFIVNVSAMEGQFSRISKGHRHPHTNMAKAAMNMMTRTSGLEYQMDEIYMTAVDTGWVTDERPFQQAKHETNAKGFVPPLDCQDGAARVYHPIFHGLNPNNSPYFSVFLKDYKPFNW